MTKKDTGQRSRGRRAKERLVKYTAYELVNLEDRSVLHFPAPGVTVYLAAQIEKERDP